ncbi:glycosyltransferase, MGT family [Nostoc sp. PCC 7524]|uniref:glycosyltransferase n=1 Tax=Nostoc sp. (strain ATCC 29411 / PCC 7524) TaxID=28072 RepID=UPI00029F34BB|nr:nucleotide disphospho-sugar-binding domain-containing protein [Nostoc sp. PCC 7524]AFY50881.1 glycosyltransferase, MGT family [Nostoc sp. PCC 7524]
MKFLFCPLASHGFVYPSIGIAQILKRRKHQVAFVTDIAFSGILQQAGLERIPRTNQDGASFQVGVWAKPIGVSMQIKHIQYALDQFAPDVLVTHQLTLGVLIVGELYNLPICILGGAAYLLPTSTSVLERPPISETEARLLWRYEEMMKLYNLNRQLWSLPSIHCNYRDTPLLGDLFLLQSLPELEPDVDQLPEKVHLIGDCLWEPPVFDPDLMNWLNDAIASGEQIIYVQPGRSFGKPGFWPNLVEVLANLPVRVVAVVSRMDSELGEIPQNFLVRDHIPQGLILPYAKAVISSGHTTTVLGAIKHGVPSLLIPNGSGTEEIAERCQTAGIAICLSPNHITNQTIEQAVHQLLNCRQIQQNSQVLQQAFSKVNGCEQAADLLIKLAITSPKGKNHLQSQVPSLKLVMNNY